MLYAVLVAYRRGSPVSSEIHGATRKTTGILIDASQLSEEHNEQLGLCLRSLLPFLSESPPILILTIPAKYVSVWKKLLLVVRSFSLFA